MSEIGQVLGGSIFIKPRFLAILLQDNSSYAIVKDPVQDLSPR
jgi:hypothetical protein